MQALRKIEAHALLTPHGFLRGGMITVDAEGTILDISVPESPDAMQEVEFFSGILIPGMVNAHTHLELSYLCGAISEKCGFRGFASQLRENRGRYEPEDILRAMDYWDARMWVDGVQAAGDICNGNRSFAIKKTSHIYYHSFIELFGLGAGAEAAAHADKLMRESADIGIRASMTPHSVYSLNESGFRLALGDDPDSLLSVHFMESPGEKDLFEGRGEIKEWYDDTGMTTDFTSLYSSPAERMAKLVSGDRKVLLVHNTMVTEQEIRLLSEHFGNNLTFVLCPRSNMFITGMMPPYELLDRHEVRVAIGTDSLASNKSLSMVDELKLLKNVPLEEALTWSTLGGAQALGIDDRYGSFEVGKCPGVVLLSGVDWENMSLTPDAKTKRLI